MSIPRNVLVLTTALVAVAGPALAQAGTATAPAGKSAGDIMLRLRGLAVLPQEGAQIGVIGGDVEIENDYIPELDVSYFFTDSIAVEVIAGTTRHAVAANNTLLGNVGLGEVSLLPPTVTLQYHPLPKARFSPYFGAGVNYTIFYDKDAPGGVVTNIDYENTFGWALQAGIDINVSGNWYANLDVKKLFLNTDVSLNGGAITAEVDIDPLIVGVGFGYKF